MASPGSYKGQVITAGTDADISRQIKEIDARIPSVDAQKKTGGTIYLDKISSPVVSPATTRPETAVSAYTGVEGAISVSQDAFTRSLEERARQYEKGADQSFQALLKGLVDTEGKTALTDKEYAGTVDPAEAELKEINQQILEEQQALKNRVDRIRENKEGLFGGAVEQEVQRAERESISKQADLAVIQLSKQGRYDSAKAIADRAVAAKLEQQTQRNQILQFVYEENKDLFTKAEQREFETKQADRNRALEMEAYKEKSHYDQIIKQSDPLYKLQLEKSQYEIDKLKNPDPMGLSTETLERIQKLPVGSQEKLVNSTDTIGQLEKMQKLVAENDFVTLSNITTEAGREFQRLATDVSDKLARERTGAVVGANELTAFKRIMGVGFLNRALAPADEVNAALGDMIVKHENVRKLIDPTGEIREYLGTGGSEEDYVNSVNSALGGGSSTIEDYLSQFNQP